MGRAIGLMLAFISSTAGCLGGAVDSQSRAPVKTVTKATTVTKERTVTGYFGLKPRGQCEDGLPGVR